MRRSLSFVVYGSPRPQGSKRALPAGGKPGARPIVTDATKGLGPWKKQVAQVAGEKVGPGRKLMEGPALMRLVFFRPRPKSHYGTGRNAGVLKPSAPPFPTGKPDVLKLSRAVEDALAGVLYRDDAQIVTCLYSKRYGSPERVEVYLTHQQPHGGNDV